MNPLGFARRAYDASKERAAGAVDRGRKRSRVFDHVASAYERYKDARGDRLAAGIAYYAFLSLFPIIALAFAVAGYVVSAYPHAATDVTKAINDVLPGMAAQLPIDKIASAKQGVGIAGLAVLLWSGTGWVSALRDGMRTIDAAGAVADAERGADADADTGTATEAEGAEPAAGPPGTAKLGFVPGKLRDVVALALLGVTLLISVGMSGFATTATPWFLSELGLGDASWAGTTLRFVSLGIALLTDMAMFLVMFTRLADIRVPHRRLLRGAFFGAVGMGVLKLGGTYLVTRSTRNPVYASFAVTVGLLLWINLASRVVLFAAGWTSVYRGWPQPLAAGAS
jgi:uncharacterized BrkB/YihY/UPF0761 family membrane protein